MPIVRHEQATIEWFLFFSQVTVFLEIFKNFRKDAVTERLAPFWLALARSSNHMLLYGALAIELGILDERHASHHVSRRY